MADKKDDIISSVGGYDEEAYKIWAKLYPNDKFGFFKRDNNKETSWKYASTVNQQINPNLTKRVKWKYGGNAVGKSDKYASSEYTKKGSTYNFPYKVTAHDYGFNIPVNARIEFVVVQVCMKSSKSGASTFPSAGFYITDKHKDIDSKHPTGFHNGVWWDTSSRKVGKSDTVETYFINGSNFRQAGNKPEHLNQKYFGVDLNFAEKCEAHTVYLKWVRCKVYYTMPVYSLVHDKQSKGMSATATNPDIVKTGSPNQVTFILKQTTKAYGGYQCFDLVVPFGTTVNPDDVTPTKGTFENNRWSVNCNGVTEAKLIVPFVDYTVDTQAITLKSANCGYEPYAPSKSYYYVANYGTVDDYGDTVTSLITPSPHYRHPCCFLLSSKFESTNDSTFQFDLTHDFDFENMSCEIVGSTDPNISIASYTDNKIVLNVTEDTVANVDIQICLRPLETGLKHFEGRTHNGGGKHNQVEFTIAEPYEYHFTSKNKPHTIERFNTQLNKETIGFIPHRVASTLETGAYILPCRVKEHDSLMKQSNPAIHMYKWEQLDYIGCVPLEHLHFDPKSTYKDKLLDSHYKNKRYMGKELASDEDITLNVRLHPQQVTTIQGLIDMDKPIPINANHRCFEGDALNHRGWAEIYGIVSTLTNPHWYKCDIDVKYLTHNLNTRFKVNKGDKTFDKTIPVPLLESVESGDSLVSETEEHDYFIVDTDGGYIYNGEEIQSTWYTNEDGQIVIFIVEGLEYDRNRIEQEYQEEDIIIVTGETEVEFEDLLQQILDEGYSIISARIGVPIEVDDTEYSNENQRNIFTLDEGQHFNIRTKEPLSQVSQVGYDWTTTLIAEEKENHISKIVRLVDTSTSNPMFEYEYSDFDFSEYEAGDSQIKCHIIARVFRKGDYDEAFNDDIYIPVTVMDEDESDEDYVPMYGSTLTFKLNNNVLTVEDTGYTGKAVNFDVTLEGVSYTYEVEWKNNNPDGEDADITTYVDLTVQDSILASRYASKYGNMIVSPFPVSDKKLIFTRQGEEGILYYYENDEEEFSYLIEPYYQYHNGVDLRTADGISIFNLNYGYRTVYLENGLVSLGINRLNGQMYLRKWDNESKQYITLFYFQLENYDDINLNNISDDRIELQASNTLISMYRGHPYVILKHGLENIKILSQFGRVWAEEVGDSRDTYPRYFDLLNTANLLPACVGGTNTIDNDCLKVYECGDTVDCEIDEDLCKTHSSEIINNTFRCPDLDTVCLDLKLSNEIYIGEETQLNVASPLIDGDTIYYYVDDVEKDSSEIPTMLSSLNGVSNGKTVIYKIDDGNGGYIEVGSSVYPNMLSLCDLNVSYNLKNGDKIYFIVDGDVLDQEQYVMTYPTPVPFTFEDTKEHEVSAVFVGDDTRSYAIAPTVTIMSDQRPPSGGGGGGGGTEDCPKPQTGKYVLSIDCPNTFKYRDGQKIRYRLTRGGNPVCGKIVEIVDFKYMNTATTDKNGYVETANTHLNAPVGSYKLGARFYEGTVDKPITYVFKDVKVVKNDVDWRFNGADTVNSYAFFKLHQKGDVSKPLANTKVTVYIDGKATTKKTNDNGTVGFKITKKGNHKYKCVFAGDKNYKGGKKSFKEKVRSA